MRFKLCDIEIVPALSRSFGDTACEDELNVQLDIASGANVDGAQFTTDTVISNGENHGELLDIQHSLTLNIPHFTSILTSNILQWIN